MPRKIIIGVPTYNRAEKVHSFILKLLSYTSYADNIEVIVIDNSNSENRKLLALEKNNKSLRYIKNEKNLGLDGSILKLIDMAAQKKALICFLSDDDHLYFTSYMKYLEFLKSTKRKVNFCKFDYKTRNIHRMDYNNKYYNATRDDYLRASFLPTICIDTDGININEYQSMIGTDYIHVGIINSLISSPGEAIVFSEPVGLQTENVKTRFDVVQTFIVGYAKALNFQNVIDKKFICFTITRRMVGLLLKSGTPFSILNNNFKVIYQTIGLLNIVQLYLRIMIRLYVLNRWS